MTSSILEYTEELLHAIRDLRVTQGRSAYHELDEGFWMVTTQPRPDQQPEHLITLSLGRSLRKAAQDLAWGLAPLAAPDVFRWCGRTDRRGQFRVADLMPGEYRLKYVLCVRQEEDVQLLQQLADPRAWEALDEAQHDPSLPDAVRRLAAEAIPVPPADKQHWIADLLAEFRAGGPAQTTAVLARGPRRAPSARQATPSEALYGSSAARVSTSAGSLSAKSAQARLSLAEVPTLTRLQATGDALDIRQPADRVPYGVGCVLALGASRKELLGTCLVGLPEYETADGTLFCSARVRIAEILKSERDPLAVDYYLVPATLATPAMPDTLASFRLGEVEQLLKQPSVADNVNLKDKIKRLTDLLKRQPQPDILGVDHA